MADNKLTLSKLKALLFITPRPSKQDWLDETLSTCRHRDITFYLTRQGAARYKLNEATLLNLPTPLEQKLHKNKNRDAIKKGLLQELLSGDFNA